MPKVQIIMLGDDVRINVMRWPTTMGIVANGG